LTGGSISTPPPLPQQPGGHQGYPGSGHGGGQHHAPQHGGSHQPPQEQQDDDLLWKIFRKLEKACCVVM